MTDLEPNLQRLVDGEMNARDRAKFLQQAEADPRSWREIALAFVEHQRLQEDLGDLFTTEDNIALTPNNVTSLSSQRRTSWWAFAAALMAMLVTGYLLGNHKPSQTGLAVAQVEPTQTGNNPPLRLLEHTPSNKMVELPAYDEQTLLQRAPQTRDDGWQVGWQTNVLTGQLKNGRRVAVPVTLPAAHYRGQ